MDSGRTGGEKETWDGTGRWMDEWMVEIHEQIDVHMKRKESHDE